MYVRMYVCMYMYAYVLLSGSFILISTITNSNSCNEMQNYYLSLVAVLIKLILLFRISQAHCYPLYTTLWSCNYIYSYSLTG